MSSPSHFTHALTVDVEDFFHVEAFRKQIDQDRWGEYPLRVVDSTKRVLDLFDAQQVKATFFTLGWVARQAPSLVREIVDRGHELACHSYWHRLVYGLDPEEFRRDTREAVAALQDAAGVRVRGYRSPSYSITKRSLWALEILAEEGFAYDSSIFPIRHDTYGMPEFPRFPVRVAFGGAEPEFIEFPPSTTVFAGSNLPGPGGGYLRIFPRWYAAWALRRIERRDRRPATVYFHPWEIDPDQPRLSGPLKSRLRHYTGLRSMEKRLTSLLKQFSFAPMGDVLAHNPPTETWRAMETVGAEAGA